MLYQSANTGMYLMNTDLFNVRSIYLKTALIFGGGGICAESEHCKGRGKTKQIQ